jgi:BirA family biotin operon repressor/biotin-[acetyl-CoA-carboxylase] ligase
MVTAQELHDGLKSKVFGSKIYTFETIDSTNTCARVLAGCWAPEGTVVISEEQTAGRGRLGRTWIANPHENLTFSLVVRPGGTADNLNLLPLYVGVAIAEAVEKVTGLQVSCKWPNDLLVGGRKVAGILIEGSLKESVIDYVVIGIGVNVNQRIFPEGIAAKATSLALQAGHDVDRVRLFQRILEALELNYHRLNRKGFGDIIPLWVRHSNMVGSRVSVSQNGTVMTGTVKGLSNHGELVLDHDGVETAFIAGDVTILDHSYMAH